MVLLYTPKAFFVALKESGAEVWLLTEFQPSTHDSASARLPKAVQIRITTSRILDMLNSGDDIEDEQSQIIQVLNRLPLINKILGLFKILKLWGKFKSVVFPRRFISSRALEIIQKKRVN